jgi:hypothetical protein
VAEQSVGSPAVSVDLEKELAAPRLVALLFCDWANQTRDGKNNLVGAFDRIFVREGQKETHAFFIFLRTAETVGEPLQVTIFSPGGAIVAGLQYGVTEFHRDIEHPEHPLYIQIMLPVQFPVPMPGVYWVNISYGGKSLGGAALIVELAKPEAQNGVNRNNS